jgi:hypothetical protein
MNIAASPRASRLTGAIAKIALATVGVYVAVELVLRSLRLDRFEVPPWCSCSSWL